jgi:hypothetical protein
MDDSLHQMREVVDTEELAMFTNDFLEIKDVAGKAWLEKMKRFEMEAEAVELGGVFERCLYKELIILDVAMVSALYERRLVAYIPTFPPSFELFFIKKFTIITNPNPNPTDP